MKILLAEDDPVLRCLLEELLSRWGHETIVAEDGSQAALAVMERQPFDVAILDWMMPGTTGPDICRVVRELYVDRRPFVLMLTAKSQLEDVVEGLDAGADEYLTKPYRPAELAARLRVAERLMKLQDELIEARRLVAYQATHDLATGALNRSALLGVLHDLMKARQSAPAPLSVVRIDVGGRPGGRRVRIDDDLLKSVVTRLESIAPAGAVVGRTGDTELLVVFPEAGEEDAQRQATAIELGLRACPIASPVGPVTVRFDTGVVTAQSAVELDLAWLLCALDTLTLESSREAESGRHAVGRAS